MSETMTTHPEPTSPRDEAPSRGDASKPRRTTRLLGAILRNLLPLAILAVGVAMFAAFGKQDRPKMQEREAAFVPSVETVTLESHGRILDLDTNGVVVPAREISISAEVEGRIVFKAENCRAGRYVEKGDVLFRIDPQTYDLEVERLTQMLAQSKLELEELEVELENTRSLLQLANDDLELRRKDVRRIEGLALRKVATASAVDEVKRSEIKAHNEVVEHENQIRLIEARRKKLESGLELARVELEQAQLDQKRTEVRSSVGGVVISDEVESDSYVQKGTELVTIEDTSSAEIKCSLQMEELNWLWRQAPQTVKSDEGPPVPPKPGGAYRIPPTSVTITYEIGRRKYTWEGTLDRYDGLGLDERTRMVPVRVLVADPQAVSIETQGDPTLAIAGPRALVRGMFVTVEIHARPESQMLRIPERAVRPGDTVWLVDDGKLRIRRIRIADTFDDTVLIAADDSSLSKGDRVIVSPLSFVEDGMAIRENTQR